jgi:hypothetical protein
MPKLKIELHHGVSTALRALRAAPRFDRDGWSWLQIIADRGRPPMRCAECSSKRVIRRRRGGIDANHSPRLARAPRAAPSCASQRSRNPA